MIEKVEDRGILVQSVFQASSVVASGGFGGNALGGKQTVTLPYYVVDPIPKAKPNAKASLPGVYHVIRIDKDIPVVQRLEIKKDELPKKDSK